MKSFHNIRKSFYNRHLKKQLRLRNRARNIHNFTTAQTAGIIFQCKTEEEFQQVKEFKNYLGDHSIKTKIIGYIHDKTIPDHFLLRTGYNFFCLKNLNWYYKPENHFIQDFIDTKFDILFDLSLSGYLPVQYIVKLNMAEYKIGRFVKKGETYDLMIDIQKNRNLGYLIEQIKHYLNMIKSKRA